MDSKASSVAPVRMKSKLLNMRVKPCDRLSSVTLPCLSLQPPTLLHSDGRGSRPQPILGQTPEFAVTSAIAFFSSFPPYTPYASSWLIPVRPGGPSASFIPSVSLQASCWDLSEAHQAPWIRHEQAELVPAPQELTTQ